MPGPAPTVIITNILQVNLNDQDNTKVDMVIDFRMLFTPSPSSPPLAEQATLTLDGGFSKQDARSAAIAAVTASVANQGATLNSNRIFGVDDLV